jgi:hypothetical protein
MVLYTPAAAAAGSTSAMNTLVNNAISLTNKTYTDSGIIQRLRLVYAAPGASVRSAAAVRGVSKSTAGRWITSGFVPEWMVKT